MKEHQLVVEALKTRDPDKAVKAMAEHLDHVHANTIKEMAR